MVSLRHLFAAILACASITLAACGGSHEQAPSGASGNASVTSSIDERSGGPPGQSLASVAGVPIARTAVLKLMAQLGAAEGPVPDAPAYTACIARLRAAASGAHSSGPTRLREQCQARYQRLFRAALSEAIHTQWLIAEAAEEGVRVSNAEVEHEAELSKKGNFRTNTEFLAYLKKTKQSEAEFLDGLKVGKLSDGIFARIRRQARPAITAEITRYYEKNPQRFTIPQGRDVRIVRTTTRVGALRAKQQIEAGTSFASIAKRLTGIAQPVRSKDGLVKGLVPHFYSEPELNDAIFSARRGKVYGPVFVAKPKVLASEPASGYFIFEVVSVTPGRKVPLSRVRSELATKLTEEKKDQVLAGAVKAFRSKWIARTDCSAGYVVANCRQSKETTASPQDPYTL